MKNAFFAVVFVLTLSCAVFASQENPIIINNPENLQIFNGIMNEPVYFQISSSEPFNLHVQIMAPYENGYDANAHRISILVLDGARREIMFGYEDSYFWSTEKIGGVHYFAGPQFNGEVPAGTYQIKLSTNSNATRYALRIGDGEQFNAGRFFTLPAIGKLVHLIGLFVIAGCAITLILAVGVSRKSKETNRIIAYFYYAVKKPARYGIALSVVGILMSFANVETAMAKIILLFVIAVHLSYFLASAGPRFEKLKGKAILTGKFFAHISRNMIVQLILVIISVFLVLI